MTTPSTSSRHPALSAQPAARRHDLHEYSLRVTMMSMANAVLQSAALTLYAWEGDMPWPALAAFVPLALGVPLLFAVLIGSGLSQRFKESAVLPAQAVAACAVQLSFLVVAPQLSLLFLVGVMITFNIFMLGTKPAHMTRAWVVLAVAAGVALWLVRGRFRYPQVNDLGLYALWLYFLLAVRQLTVLGVQCGTLRGLLYERKGRLSKAVANLHERAGEERLLERERISRELHDTLLQGVQALVLRIHGAAEGIPKDEQARAMMDKGLAWADQVVLDARERLVTLRDVDVDGTERDVAEAIVTAGRELSRDFGVPFEFRVTGRRRPSQVDDDVFRLGRDLMINAFQQVGVKAVEVHLHYGEDSIDVRLREDRSELEVSAADQAVRDHAIAILDERASRLGGRIVLSTARHGLGMFLCIPDVVQVDEALGRPRFESRAVTPRQARA